MSGKRMTQLQRELYMKSRRQGLSDFTHPRTAITILGNPFEWNGNE